MRSSASVTNISNSGRELTPSSDKPTIKPPQSFDDKAREYIRQAERDEAPSSDTNELEPTTDWLIDELAPNSGNSPLINFNKDRLRKLIAKKEAEAYKKGYIDGSLAEGRATRNFKGDI
jgi:hypothetical protein